MMNSACSKCNTTPDRITPFPGQFRRQCMHFWKSAGNFGGSAFRRPFGHDSAAGLSKFVTFLPNSMHIVHKWLEKGVLSLAPDRWWISDKFSIRRCFRFLSAPSLKNYGKHLGPEIVLTRPREVFCSPVPFPYVFRWEFIRYFQLFAFYSSC